MKAIHTYKSEGYRGSYVATDHDGNRVVVPRDFRLGAEEMHEEAALALCRKTGWHGTLVRGWLRKGEYVWVWCKDSVVTPRFLEVPEPTR